MTAAFPSTLPQERPARADATGVIVHARPAGFFSDLWSVAAETGRFVVHICRESDRAMAEVFAGLRPSPGGMFAGQAVTDTEWGPVLDDLTDRAFCRLVDRSELGHSGVLTGEIDRIETADLARAKRFYTEALGLKPAGEVRGETLFELQNGQMVGVKEVKELSERTKKKGRACHVAFNVSQENYDMMLERIPKIGGRTLGDFRATDGLRPPGERSIYFFDPDTNYLQITALGDKETGMISDDEKWKLTVENRQKQGRGISSFDKGVKIQK